MSETLYSQSDINRMIGERLSQQKAIAAMEQREKSIAEKEAAFARRSFEEKAVQIMADRKIPAELLPALNVNDEESLIHAINLIDQVFNITSPKLVAFTPPASFYEGDTDPGNWVSATSCNGLPPGHWPGADEIGEAMGLSKQKE